MLSSKYGLGVDQILGATVIDAQGVVREADETMLTAIRGAGGIVGVIAELKIRIYPLDQVSDAFSASYSLSDKTPGACRSHHISTYGPGRHNPKFQ
jgi:FAD/FMN-containing dehydrogenase